MTRMASYLHWIVAGVFLVAMPGCDLARQLQPPTVTDTTIQWVAGAPRRLTARIDQSGAYEIAAVFVRYTRHRWPGHQAANQFAATPVSDGANVYIASPPDAVAAPRGDHLFWEWFVEYRLPDGNDIETVRSGRHDLVVGCTAADTRATLMQLAAEIRKYDRPDPEFNIFTFRYQPKAHGLASLANNGVTFAGRANLDHDRIAEVGDPHLLFYAPRDRIPGESEEAYLAAITETENRDEPYRIIGAAWTEVHRNAKRRPHLMDCIPSSEWFVHESGFHQSDGRMRLVPPEEDFLGQVAVSNEDPTPAQLAQAPSDMILWHPRIWDLHLWLPDDPDALPFLSIYSPRSVPGLIPCSNADITEFVCPNLLFYYSETFE